MKTKTQSTQEVLNLLAELKQNLEPSDTKQIAIALNTSTATVYNYLNSEGTNYNTACKILSEAKKIIQERAKIIKKLKIK